MQLLEFEKEVLSSVEEEINALRLDESEKSADVVSRMNKLQQKRDKSLG